jgi:hypothetical protein
LSTTHITGDAVEIVHRPTDESLFDDCQRACADAARMWEVALKMAREAAEMRAVAASAKIVARGQREEAGTYSRASSTGSPSTCRPTSS